MEQSSGMKTLLTSEATHHLMSPPESWPVFHNKRKDEFIPKCIRPGMKFILVKSRNVIPRKIKQMKDEIHLIR